MTAIGIAACVGYVIVFAADLYMWKRNEWVYRQRTYILDNHYHLYSHLPSYGTMMKKWWVWDIKKFLPSEVQP